MGEIIKLCRNRKLIGYGAGLAFLGTQEGFPLPVSYLVDDTPGLEGTEIAGVPVFRPERLFGEKRNDLFIIIYAYWPRAVSAISAALKKMGFEYGRQFIDCSTLHFESMGKRLKAEFGIAPRREIFARCRELSLSSPVPSLSYIAGSWLLIELLDSLLPRVHGGVAECGAYHGGNALIALALSGMLEGRPYHLFDSFAGFPGARAPLSKTPEIDFAAVDLEDVRRRFSNFDNVHIHSGPFEETFPPLEDRAFSLVYSDCDLYESTLACCQFFWERISEGGAMLFHDYWVPGEKPPHRSPFLGVQKAVKEFFAASIEKLIVFPETTHALLRKEPPGKAGQRKKERSGLCPP